MVDEKKELDEAAKVDGTGGQEQAAEPFFEIAGTKYSQSEMETKMALAKIAEEAQEKYDKPIQKYWPEYTRTKQEVLSLREKLAGMESKAQAPVSTTGELSDEERKANIIKQAEGFGLVHAGNIDQYIDDRMEKHQLRDTVKSLLSEAKEQGLPEVTLQEFGKFMDEQGIQNPEVAYREMFRDQLASIQEKRVKELKPQGLKTQETSTAGANKVPEAPALTRDNLREAIRAGLNKSSGLERT